MNRDRGVRVEQGASERVSAIGIPRVDWFSAEYTERVVYAGKPWEKTYRRAEWVLRGVLQLASGQEIRGWTGRLLYFERKHERVLVLKWWVGAKLWFQADDWEFDDFQSLAFEVVSHSQSFQWLDWSPCPEAMIGEKNKA